MFFAGDDYFVRLPLATFLVQKPPTCRDIARSMVQVALICYVPRAATFGNNRDEPVGFFDWPVYTPS
jgi:hypothetical protein